MYLLDTNVCIKYLNGKSESIKDNIEKYFGDDEILLCSVVKAELYFGASKSSKIYKNISKLENFTRSFKSMSFDDEAAIVYGEIRARLQKKGQIIGANDLLIAAIAISNELVLVTHNTKEFLRISELEIVDWEK